MEVRARGERPMACTHTYGCQGNVADGERIDGLLAEMGFGFTDNPDEADLILYNTCAVREHAEDRVYGNVGALKHVKRRHPDTIIVLCGCMVQQQHVADRIRESFPYVNIVFGTHVIHRFPELLFKALTNSSRIFELSQQDASIHENIPVVRRGSVKAWLPVMYGCDNFCSYCVVPYVRGRERSRDAADIEREFDNVLAAGFKDITLLGQNVNSYGRKDDAAPKFPELLRRLNQRDGEFFIRFMTSHPKDCSVELLDAMSDCEHVAKHLHLPFQSGSSEVLKRMNRRYTREKYLELVSMARERMPDISITSDVIVGFPGETREQFEETLSLISEVQFTSLFTFIYSPRKGTPAADMPDGISHREKAERMAELIKLQESISAKRCASMVGGVQRVLIESAAGDGMLSCRTSGNVMLEAPGTPDMIGRFADAEITSAKNFVLSGKIKN